MAPGALLTRIMFKLNNVPAPDNGVESLEAAERCNVLIGPGPGKMLPVIVQLPEVSPAFDATGSWKVITVESNVKSPWNPIRLSAPSIEEVATG